MTRFNTSLRVLLAAAFAILTSTGDAAARGRELRVCADPNNLPFSNQKLEGFENRIATLVADELHATVQYTFRPQRRGFIRRTLKAKECDVVIGVPAEYDEVLATKPYYRSTYVFVYASGKEPQIRSFDDPSLRHLRIGLPEFTEEGANAPPAHALARRGIVGNIVGFKMWDVDSVKDPQGTIVEAVAAGKIDIAIVWGPVGGYFAKRQQRHLEVVPVSPALDPPALPFVFDVSMGVRHGDEAFKKELEGVLDRRRGDIRQILEQFGVPLVESSQRAAR
jgi:mxaJ protein